MYAIDLLNQFQDYNGTVLSNGKMYVYFLGRVALANVYHDVDGQVPIANPVELDNLGMAQVYVSNAHDYTIVLTDVYGNEMFSRDLFVNGSAEGGGNARLYEGIDPIVVNNEQNIISAKLANLGVESPLYFIEDTEESTVIGVSGDFVTVSASGNLTAYKEDDVTWISGKDWSTDITNASANAYEQATANDYRPLFEGNNGKISAIDNSAILIPDVVDYSAGANINISNHVVSLDTAVELTDIINNRGAILDPSGLYVSNLQQTTYTEVGKDHVLSTDGSASIGWQLGNKAISISDDSGNGDYRNLILGLDDVLLEERHQEPTPDKVYSLTGACESALSAINMINSGDNQAYSAGANINITDHVISGKDWSTEIGDKLDATAFSTVSGDFLTSLPADLVYTGDITGKADTSALTAYQTTAGMTAYQPTGDYLTTADSANFYTTANESGFITGVDLTPYQTIEGMTAYQPVGDYLTTADSAQFYTNDNPSGFITGVDLSNYATTAEVADKLDTTAFSDVSGSFLTAHQDLSDYQTTAGMTAYQPAGNYLTAVPDSALSGFIPYSASGIELPNSNFKIDVSGQAYKGEEVASTIPVTGIDYSNNYSFILKSTLINAGTTTFYIKNPDCRYVLVNYKQMDWNPIEEFRSDDPITSITINTSYLEQGSNYIMFAWSTTKTADKWNGPLADSAIELEYAGGTAIEYVPYLTTLPVGTMNESSFAYDTGNNITAYNGSAFAGGGGGSELPESASEALNVVTSNSASWDEISAYIASSASYITSLPSDLVYTGDITGKLDTTAFSTVSGDFYTTANESGKSAFDELKSSYDALSSLFSTYSGQWLLPNVSNPKVLSSTTANVTFNEGSFAHGNDFGFVIDNTLSDWCDGFKDGKLSAVIQFTDKFSWGRTNENIRWSYDINHIQDNDFCGEWYFDENTYTMTAVISGFGNNSASPTAYPVYLSFPYTNRNKGESNPITISGYVQ